MMNLQYTYVLDKQLSTYTNKNGADPNCEPYLL